ncbi:MAG: TOMM precursor leader peptide-binding protein, partial [Streptomyces sp.]|uniref:TOMM precursor leader peptide-binding protein n=1 Tax=Streptomyces sp. TaxID=1931 RepID=UPI003D6A2B9F
MATSAYEAVAATRPRIRRDVLFTETPQGVLFHNADGGFQLTAASAYRFATLIVPHLNGQHSVSDICHGFGDGQRAMLGELVRTLYSRGFARDVPEPEGEPEGQPPPGLPSPEAARRFAPQIAYVDHYTDEPDRRFQRFRQARVAVLGDDLVARWCALSLIRNGGAAIGVLPGLDRTVIDAEAQEAAADGCPVELTVLADGRAEGRSGGPGRGHTWAELESFDITVVTGGPFAAQRLFPLLRAGIPEGRTLIPAWSYGADAVMGPLMSRDRTGCWSCAVLRLGANGGPAAAADLWSALALPGAGPAGGSPDAPLAAMIGNMLGYEVFRLTTGALRAETDGQLIVQDMESLDVTSEPLLPHPRCPRCAEVARDAEAGTAADAGRAAAADLATAGAGALPMPTVATAREADALVEELNKRSGLVRPHAGVFTRFADESLTQIPLKAGTVELGIGHAGPRRIAAFDVHHVAGARIRALNAAAVVYAEHVVPAAPLPVPPPGPERETVPALAPGAFSTASGTGGTAAEVPAWSVATSMITKERMLVPAAAVRTLGPANAGRLFEPTSAGSGAGSSLPDAAARGLLSALAHDALVRTVRGAAAARVDLDPLVQEGADAELTFLVRSVATLGLEGELLDLGESGRSGVHVLLARTAGEWAVGSETSWTAAAAAALRDLLGRIQLGREYGSTPVDTGDPLLRDLAPGTLTTTDATTAAAGGSGDPAAWPDVLERLRAAGLQAAPPLAAAEVAGVQ